MKKRKLPNLKSKSSEAYLKYSGLAFQMMAVLLLGVFGGVKIDHWINLGFPLFTLLLSLGGLAVSIYMLIRGLSE